MRTAPHLREDGRDPERVPENWTELIDPTEWRLNDEGLPARRAARVLALRESPDPEILLVVGHDFGDSGHSWAFTPGGGLLDSGPIVEEFLVAARARLQEQGG